MNRRDLLKTLGVLAVAASAPSPLIWAKEKLAAQRIMDSRFVLHKPFVIESDFGVQIFGCQFIAAPDFRGESLVIVRGSGSHYVSNCCLDTGGLDIDAIRFEGDYSVLRGGPSLVHLIRGGS